MFTSIINKRISVTLETKQPIEQAGFRKSFSTIDHIYTLELIMEKYQEKQRMLYIAYIDYKINFRNRVTLKYMDCSAGPGSQTKVHRNK